MSVYDVAEIVRNLIIGAAATTAVTTALAAMLSGFAPRFTLRCLLWTFPPGHEEYCAAVFADLDALPSYRKKWHYVGVQLETAVSVALPARIRYRRAERIKRGPGYPVVPVRVEIIAGDHDKHVVLKVIGVHTREQLNKAISGLHEGQYRIVTHREHHPVPVLQQLGLIGKRPKRQE